MKKNICFFIILSLILSSPSFAAFEWHMCDFGTGPIDYNNNWGPIIYSYDIGNLSSPGLPGEGGEKFDIEGSNFSHNNDKKLETNSLRGSGDTYILEFDASMINDFEDYKSMTFHNTLACGNDLIEKSYAPVPEPSTLILLGLGTLGLAAYRRRR